MTVFTKVKNIDKIVWHWRQM